MCNYIRETRPRENAITATVATTATQITNREPRRVMLAAVNTSGNNGYLGVSNAVAATQGFLVAANGGQIILTKDTHYDLPTLALWAINLVASGTWWFLEMLEVPEGFEGEDA